MDERVTWIMHRGVKILSINHSNIRWDEEHFSIIKKAAELMEANKEVRYLVDLSGSYISGSVAFNGATILKPAEKNVIRRAFLGATGYKATLIKTMTFFDGNAKVFRERQAALDFLSE